MNKSCKFDFLSLVKFNLKKIFIGFFTFNYINRLEKGK